MTGPLAAVLVGLLAPWPISWLSRRGASPRLAVASQLACLLLAWSGVLVVVADIAAPRTGVLRACATVVAALARGNADVVAVTAAAVYGLVLGRTVWCLASLSSRSRRTVGSIRAVAVRDGATWVLDEGPSAGFTAGLLRPVVVVSAEHGKHLSAATKRVVLAHERAHAKGRHTAVDLVARALAAGLTPWAGARLATVEVRRNLEACADDGAAKAYGPTAVARAIGHVALMPSLGLAPVTLGAIDWPVWRVQRLLEPRDLPLWGGMSASAATASSVFVGAQGAAHALAGAHLLPVASLCPW